MSELTRLSLARTLSTLGLLIVIFTLSAAAPLPIPDEFIKSAVNPIALVPET